MLFRLKSVAAAALFAPLAPLTPAAQDAVHLCEERAASAIIHVAVCREVASDPDLAAEGRRICAGDLPCGVWFWLDEADIPDEPPENHDGLTQAQITSSIGVFAAEQDMFIRIERVEN